MQGAVCGVPGAGVSEIKTHSGSPRQTRTSELRARFGPPRPCAPPLVRGTRALGWRSRKLSVVVVGFGAFPLGGVSGAAEKGGLPRSQRGREPRPVSENCSSIWIAPWPRSPFPLPCGRPADSLGDSCPSRGIPRSVSCGSDMAPVPLDAWECSDRSVFASTCGADGSVGVWGRRLQGPARAQGSLDASEGTPMGPCCTSSTRVRFPGWLGLPQS